MNVHQLITNQEKDDWDCCSMPCTYTLKISCLLSVATEEQIRLGICTPILTWPNVIVKDLIPRNISIAVMIELRKVIHVGNLKLSPFWKYVQVILAWIIFYSLPFSIYLYNCIWFLGYLDVKNWKKNCCYMLIIIKLNEETNFMWTAA